MTTLAIMKARIAKEIRRSNISTEIGEAINTAIDAYKGERLWFAEQYHIDIDLVEDQEFYTADDNVWLGRVSRIDYAHLVLSGQSYGLRRKTDGWLDIASPPGSSGGQPYCWGWYANTLRVYPVPAASGMKIRLAGQFEMDAPASDSETGNPWMIEAETLIRSRAKFELYQHLLLDLAKAAIFDPDRRSPSPSPTLSALQTLRRKSSAKASTGRVTAWTT